MAEAPINFNNYGHQVTVIKLEPWVKATIMDNMKIVPINCKHVLRRALQTGFVEDWPRFDAAFNVLLRLLKQIKELRVPEGYRAVMEGDASEESQH